MKLSEIKKRWRSLRNALRSGAMFEEDIVRRIVELEIENERYREALEFYADPYAWEDPSISWQAQEALRGEKL